MSNNQTTLTIGETKELLFVLLMAQLNGQLGEKARGPAIKRSVPCVLGSPGIGKTDIITQVAVQMATKLGKDEVAFTAKPAKNQLGILDWRATFKDPIEVGGAPALDHENKAVVRYQGEDIPRSGIGILYIDEAFKCPAIMQNVIASIVYDRRVNQHKLGNGWLIVLSSNRVEDRSGDQRILGHLANRLMFIHAEASAPEVIEYGQKNNWHGDIIEYLTEHPDAVDRFNPEAIASPTPRSWEQTSEVLNLMLSTDVERACVEGLIGLTEASAFYKNRTWGRTVKVTPSMVFNEPDSSPIPADSNLDALFGKLAMQINTKDKALATVKYMRRLAKTTSAERPMVFITMMEQRNNRFVHDFYDLKQELTGAF